MHRTIRALCWVGTLAATLSLLQGCGDSAERTGAVTLRVAVWKANNPEAWDEALRLFHEAHPGIRVELETGPNSSTQLHDLITQKLRNRDSSLDAFLMDVIWPPEFAAASWALPLDDRFPPDQRARFFPGCIEAVTFEGKIHGIPFNTDAGLLYYREDLLDKYGLRPPESWPEMALQIEAIRRGEGNSRLLHGFSGQFKQYEGLVCNMLEYIHSNGGRMIAPASPEAVEAITFVRDRIIGGLAPRGVLTYEEQESLDLFKSGGAIFLRSWPYAWKIVNDPRHSEITGKVGIACLPAFKEGLSSAALGGWSFGIHSRSHRPQEAWDFVNFMTGPQMQRHFAIKAGKAPARRALYSDPGVLEANPHFANMLPVFETATPRPRSPIYPRISHILQRCLHKTISNPDSDARALAEKAERRIRDEVQKVQNSE